MARVRFICWATLLLGLCFGAACVVAPNVLQDHEIDRDIDAAFRFSLGWTWKRVRDADVGSATGKKMGGPRLKRIKRTQLCEGLLSGSGSGTTDRRSLTSEQIVWLIALVRHEPPIGSTATRATGGTGRGCMHI